MNLVRNFIGAILTAALSMMTLPALAGPIAYGVNGDENPNYLYRIDLADGTGTRIGQGLGNQFGDVEGLSFDPITGILYAIEENDDILLTINTITGLGDKVGELGKDIKDPGFAIFNGVGYLAELNNTDQLFSINLSTGEAELIGPITPLDPAINDIDIDALAFIGNTLYGSDPETDSLYTLDLLSGDATLVGAYGISVSNESGLTSDGRWLYAVDDDPNKNGNHVAEYLRIDPATGGATYITRHGQPLEALAMKPVPEPSTMLLFGSGLAGLLAWRWKKKS